MDRRLDRLGQLDPRSLHDTVPPFAHGRIGAPVHHLERDCAAFPDPGFGHVDARRQLDENGREGGLAAGGDGERRQDDQMSQMPVPRSICARSNISRAPTASTSAHVGGRSPLFFVG